MLTEVAPAKINLALHVRARRPDGYHVLETIFAFVRDGDVLRAEPAEDLSLTISGPFGKGLETEGNLVLQAAEALRSHAGANKGAALHLEKNLPVASGLGGGSSDAAAALRILNRLWKLDCDLTALEPIAAALGADIPACLHARTLFGTERGDVLRPISIADLEGAPLLLVNPGIAVSTAEIFRTWDQQDRGALEAGDLNALAEARNDLAPPAIALAPAIAELLKELALLPGVRLSRMSGSGATCFAIFADDAAARAAADRLAGRFPDYWMLRTTII